MKRRHDHEQVAHIAALILAGHVEPLVVCKEPHAIKTAVAGARALLDEAEDSEHPDEVHAKEGEPVA